MPTQDNAVYTAVYSGLSLHSFALQDPLYLEQNYKFVLFHPNKNSMQRLIVVAGLTPPIDIIDRLLCQKNLPLAWAATIFPIFTCASRTLLTMHSLLTETKLEAKEIQVNELTQLTL